MNALNSADDGAKKAPAKVTRDYWTERFPELSATPDLPRVHRSADQSRFDRIETCLECPEWQTLCFLARQRRIHPPGIVAAVFVEVVSAWSANEDFTISLVTEPPGRRRPRFGASAGDPACSHVPLAPTRTVKKFTDRAAGICEQVSRGLAPRYLPGNQASRQGARCEGDRPGRASCGGVPVTLTNLVGRSGQHPLGRPDNDANGAPWGCEVLLDVKVQEIGGALRIVWDHRSSAFPPGLVDSMSSAFHTLLLRLSRDTRAWDEERFDLRPATQIQRRTAVNDTTRDVPASSLSDLLDERVAATPDAPALIAPDVTLTYRQLAHAAKAVAARLDSAEPLVAIGMHRGWEQFAALHGIQWAGSGYLPLDVEQPDARLRQILTNAGVRTVLVQPRTADRFRRLGAKVIVCDVGLIDPTAPASSAERRPCPDDIAYVIFTSGSTGSPKGVAVRHRAVVNHALDACERFGVGREDRLLATTGLHSDLSAFDVFGAVASGAAVVLPAHTSGPDPENWLALIRERSVTFWATVPALMEMACEAHEQAGLPVLRGLRRVVLGGDRIPLTLPSRITTLAPGARLANVGGPTETTIWSIFYEIDQVDPSWSSIPYGKPMANSAYHIVGPDWTHRPDWVPGEILVESDIALAAGYWKDPERTAKSFVTDPRSGRRVYRTGDIGRYLPDGNIEILGRTDFQVKISGYRIELGEIEYQLTSIPGVERAAVVKASSRAGGFPRLVAFVEAPSCDVIAMKNHLRSQLPAYMVPHEIRQVGDLPLTRNGKIDRARLEQEGALSTRPARKQQSDT